MLFNTVYTFLLLYCYKIIITMYMFKIKSNAVNIVYYNEAITKISQIVNVIISGSSVHLKYGLSIEINHFCYKKYNY